MAKPSRWPATDLCDAEYKIVRTSGELFADGSAIELVGCDSDSHLSLLVWNKRVKAIATQVKRRGRIYQANNAHQSLLRAIRFPSNVHDYGTAHKLFVETRTLFERYIGLAAADAALLTAWNCSTWFADCMSSPPTLKVSSPDIGPAIRLFRLLSCLSRRPLVLTDVNRAGILSLAPLQPTLLIYQPTGSRRYWDLLSTSNHRGVHVVGNGGRVHNLVGAKAVFSGTADTWNDEGIHVAVPLQHELPPLEQHMEAEIASRFQPQFLMYRLRNFHEFRESSCVRQLHFPNTEIARDLAASIQGEDDIAQAIGPILRRQNQDAQARRGSDISVVMVEVMWTPLHQEKQMTIRHIVELTNALLRARGETLEYSAVEIGWKLRNLGFDRDRNGGGKLLKLSIENSSALHQLAQGFGLELPPAIGCANCGPNKQFHEKTVSR